MNKNQLNRINVIGTSASGKSTFSKKLADLLNSPHIEMDKIFWGPDWYWPPDEEFFKNLEKSISGSNWVLDGNYTRSIPIKWQNVQTVVWIDLPFYITLYQSIIRTFKRSYSGKELWPNTGNTETFKKSFFSKDSIILWMIKSYFKVRKKYETLIINPKYSHINFVRLKSHKEIQLFINNCKKP